MLNVSRLLIGLRKIILTLLVFAITSNAHAHQVWLEKGAGGLVRVYLGEPGVADTGDKIDNLKGAHVFTDNREVLAVLNQENDHWQGTVGEGDVRFFSDKVWEPWGTGDKASWWEFWDKEPQKLQGAILQARFGRTETTAKLAYEFVPTKAGGNVFVALLKGLPLADQEVLLLTPDKKEFTLTTNEKGEVDVSTSLAGTGLYVLESVHIVDADAMHSGKKVSSLMYITTLSFVMTK